MRYLTQLILCGVIMLAGASPVLAAAEPAEAAESVDFRGYYVEDGAPVDFGMMEQLVDEFAGQGFGFVALEQDPPGGADLFAEEVRQASSARTVIVVSSGELGFVSDDYDDAALDAAADAAIGLFDRSYGDGFRAFARELAGVPAVATTSAGGGLTTPTVVPQPSPPASSGGGGGALLWLIVIVAAAVGFFVWRSRRSNQRRAELDSARLEALKDEVRKELGTAANEILELEDRVRVADNDRASELYAAGAQGYADFQETLDSATTPEEIHELGNQVDRVLWQLASAEAIIEGRDVPPEPVPEPFPEASTPPGRRADLPPELDMRRERPRPAPSGRGGGGLGSLGGLGAIAVIMREMQRASRSRPRAPRVRVGRSGSRIQVPQFPTTGRRTSGGAPRRRSSRSSARSGSRPSRPKGRGRRRR